MYAHDSFYTLSPFGQVGLVIVSLALAGVWLAGLTWLAWGRGRLVRVVLALGLFWLFEWVSPQFYYFFYIALLAVPAQIVVGAPPGPGHVAAVLSFTGPASLSAHARGVFGIVLVLLAAFGGRGVGGR